MALAAGKTVIVVPSGVPSMGGATLILIGSGRGVIEACILGIPLGSSRYVLARRKAVTKGALGRKSANRWVMAMAHIADLWVVLYFMFRGIIPTVRDLMTRLTNPWFLGVARWIVLCRSALEEDLLVDSLAELSGYIHVTPDQIDIRDCAVRHIHVPRVAIGTLDILSLRIVIRFDVAVGADVPLWGSRSLHIGS
jgi:hypothetical protein